MADNKQTHAKLFRSETDRMLGGVAGGLGEYFNIDPNIIRIIFVLLTIFGGSGILIYLILWILLPTKSSNKEKSDDNIKDNVAEIREKAQEFAGEIKKGSSRQNSQMFLGVLIIVIGAIFLLGNLGLMVDVARFWPLVLIVMGLVILFRK